MMPRKKNTKSKKVESIRHKDKRTNIPTEELRDFVADDENQPRTILYPRDPSLDPQLVWTGKDEQDQQDLAVPAVPIYIQEKIHPQAIIDDLTSQSNKPDKEQLGLFADFNGLQGFDKKVEFYKHQSNWSNRLILGDSLLVMTSLAEKEGIKGRAQLIYVDPPYGIRFASNWQVSTRNRDIKDTKSEHVTRQPEQIRAFRDTWQYGIHSYLAYLRDRLKVARNLLCETGSLFVQIGDESLHLVRCVLDEVFGADNFVSQITLKKTAYQASQTIASVTDYLLWFAKDKSQVKVRPLFMSKLDLESIDLYKFIELPDGTRRRMTKAELSGDQPIPTGARRYRLISLISQGYTETGSQPFKFQDQLFTPPSNCHWKTTPAGLNSLSVQNRLVISGKSLAWIGYIDDFPVSPLNNIWTDTMTGSFTDPKIYVVQTNLKIVERCILMTTDPGDLVIDPTCGSGSTAYAAEQWGRRWITVDTSRVALALARTRLMSGKYPFYLLTDSPEGLDKESEITGRVAPPHNTESDIRKGLVYKRVPHITLKALANNPDIKEGMSREEIDKAMIRHADQELLYDQPYEDSKKIRVSGPFTVESLSPHRVLSTADHNNDGTVTETEGRKHQDFVTMILENLSKAGVQNTIKNERLRFDSLEPHPGTWIHAKGEYADADGAAKRVAVSIGPEHGTVGPNLVKEAAKEAVQGVGFDILVVCGFAFDPHVSEEAKRYGNLTVLPTRMNPDLAMGDELLKKTGAGNLFMVFGEPDLHIKEKKDSTITVEIKGVDVYDPTTGEIRSSSTDDIACWFLDTDYNGESFFVRHAYFTGGDEPYDKLKRALRAEIDEEAWQFLYSTKSRPFPRPDSGKIAVKVINHYGDEVLKVYEL